MRCNKASIAFVSALLAMQASSYPLDGGKRLGFTPKICLLPQNLELRPFPAKITPYQLANIAAKRPETSIKSIVYELLLKGQFDAQSAAKTIFMSLGLTNGQPLPDTVKNPDGFTLANNITKLLGANQGDAKVTELMKHFVIWMKANRPENRTATRDALFNPAMEVDKKDLEPPKKKQKKKEGKTSKSSSSKAAPAAAAPTKKKGLVAHETSEEEDFDLHSEEEEDQEGAAEVEFIEEGDDGASEEVKALNDFLLLLGPAWQEVEKSIKEVSFEVARAIKTGSFEKEFSKRNEDSISTVLPTEILANLILGSAAKFKPCDCSWKAILSSFPGGKTKLPVVVSLSDLPYDIDARSSLRRIKFQCTEIEGEKHHSFNGPVPGSAPVTALLHSLNVLLRNKLSVAAAQSLTPDLMKLLAKSSHGSHSYTSAFGIKLGSQLIDDVKVIVELATGLLEASRASTMPAWKKSPFVSSCNPNLSFGQGAWSAICSHQDAGLTLSISTKTYELKQIFDTGAVIQTAQEASKGAFADKIRATMGAFQEIHATNLKDKDGDDIGIDDATLKSVKTKLDSMRMVHKLMDDFGIKSIKDLM